MTTPNLKLREKVKQLAREAAWTENKRCPACDGDGLIPGDRQVIHSRLGGIGADWDLESVLDAIDAMDWFDNEVAPLIRAAGGRLS